MMSQTFSPDSRSAVLSVIDKLRDRKARPDFTRIVSLLKRKHAMTDDGAKASLEGLIANGDVIKVDYKGETSYRNAHKWRGSASSTLGSPNNSSSNDKVTKKAATPQSDKEPRKADLSNAAAARSDAVCAQPLSAGSLDSPNFKKFLEKEVQNGRLKKRAARLYELPRENDESEESTPPKVEETEEPRTLPAEKRSPAPPERKPVMLDKVAPEKPKSIDTSAVVEKTTSSVPIIAAGTKKRGRPLSKRKRIKKTHGPDFEMLSVTKSKRKENEEDMEVEMDQSDERCVECSQPASSNRKEVYEKFLACKDCSYKAHPSCMNYREKLVKRIRRSPWQCMECKTCVLCRDSGDAMRMLVCDSCDKGYHMTCFTPVLTKPKGDLWICPECIRENGEMIPANGNATSESRDKKIKLMSNGIASLPTPSNSPTSDPDERSKFGSRPLTCLTQELSAHYQTRKFKKVSKEVKFNGDNYPDASDWSIVDVVDFFTQAGFKDHAKVFEEQEIDGKSLLLMRREDVLSGLKLKLGPAVKIFKHVQGLQRCGTDLDQSQ